IAGPQPTWAGTIPVDVSRMKHSAGAAFQSQAASHLGPADPKSHTPAKDHTTNWKPSIQEFNDRPHSV
ncbi:MAG: hypothetical protein ACE5NJ_05165, partial [Thermodesulfobacteriota bacterium]